MGGGSHTMECGTGKELLSDKSGYPIVDNALEDHGELFFFVCMEVEGVLWNPAIPAIIYCLAERSSGDTALDASFDNVNLFFYM